MKYKAEYTTTNITLNDRLLKILLPNCKGSSALPALANTLLLASRQSDKTENLRDAVRNSTVSSEELIYELSSIGSKLFGSNDSSEDLVQKFACLGIEKSKNNNHITNHLMRLLTQLNQLDQVSDGALKDPEKLSIFQLYGIRIVHGRIAESQKHNSFRERSCKFFYENIRSCDKLVNSQHNRNHSVISEAQVTDSRLKHLEETVEENSLVILFSNDNFYTLHKEGDQLLYLVAGQGNQETMWRPLNSTNIGEDPHENSLYSEANSNLFNDELMEQVQKWIGITIGSISSSNRSNIEIEMKYGVMMHPQTKKRLSLPVLVPTVYKGRTKMKPNIDTPVFDEFKKFMHTTYDDFGVTSEKKDFTYRVNVQHGKSRSLRKTVNSKTAEVEGTIEKKSLSSLFIYVPKQKYDMKLSINLEFPILNKELLQKCKTPINARCKKRVSYFKDHSDCRIDITDVEQCRGPEGKQSLEITKEIEVELLVPNLLAAWEHITEDRTRYNDIIRVFLDTATLLNNKLTLLSQHNPKKVE
ncbi:hypothetical protein BZL39_M05130 [Zygosaccharomyces parabailii]|nr:hypothetical protein BZL39_M05130 [Zygosaccharomyces parabailii]CDH10032.1 uncharacterized protein ZBAI_01817 [Zygosaccharomyces bailii ISA1307]